MLIYATNVQASLSTTIVQPQYQIANMLKQFENNISSCFDQAHIQEFQNMKYHVDELIYQHIEDINNPTIEAENLLIIKFGMHNINATYQHACIPEQRYNMSHYCDELLNELENLKQ